MLREIEFILYKQYYIQISSAFLSEQSKSFLFPNSNSMNRQCTSSTAQQECILANTKKIQYPQVSTTQLYLHM